MEYIESFLFLILLLVYISTLKANTFIIIFSASVYLFLIFQLFYLNPIEIISSLISKLLRNPYGFILLVIPLIIDTVYKGLRGLIAFKKKL